MSTASKEIGMLSFVKIVANDVYKGEMGVVTDIIRHNPPGKDYYHVDLKLGGYGRWTREELILASTEEREAWIKSSKL
jgi:hypothetical protein